MSNGEEDMSESEEKGPNSIDELSDSMKAEAEQIKNDANQFFKGKAYTGLAWTLLGPK